MTPLEIAICAAARKRRERSIGIKRCQGAFRAPPIPSSLVRYTRHVTTSDAPHASLPVRTTYRRLWLAVPTLVMMVSVTPRPMAGASLPDPADPSLGPEARVEALLSRIKHQQSELTSLEASFVQTKESLLLLEPEVSTGTFSYSAPDLARWEFTSPNQTVMIIRDGELLTWYRDLGTAERVRVDQHSAQVEQYLSATNSIDRLQRYFDMATAFPATGPYRIELTPRFDRVAKRLTSMTIWFDRDRYVPVRLVYVEPDGDATEFVFEQVTVNPSLPADRFDFALPEDVEVNDVNLAGP